MEKSNRRNDPVVQQIVNNIVSKHFKKDPNREKTIEDMEEEIMTMVAKKGKVIDFANGEDCDFNKK